MHLHIDCTGGISAAALLAALQHLGTPAAVITEALRACGLPGAAELCLDFSRHAPALANEPYARVELNRAPPWGELPLAEVVPRLQAHPAATGAAAGLSLAAAAVARSRGNPAAPLQLDQVTTAVELACSVGVAAALQHLGAGTCSVSALPLATPGGALASLSPHLLELLLDLSTAAVDADPAPLLTPLGIAWVHTLAARHGPPPAMDLIAWAAGSGPGDAGHAPPTLRLLAGTPHPPATTREELLVLETNIDDMSPELTADLIATCLEAGALDAWLTPVLMKKGRAAQTLSALTSAVHRDAVERAIFEHSSTLGIRRYPVARTILVRQQQSVQTPWGAVSVKVGLLGTRVVNRAPEYEDCRRLASAHGVALKQVYAAALAALNDPD